MKFPDFSLTLKKLFSLTCGNHRLKGKCHDTFMCEFIVHDVGGFLDIWFDFIYPHNTYFYSLLFLRYMVQPIRIRFTALSRFETNIYPHVFLQGLLCTHTNKAVNDRQTKFINKPFITDFPVCPI